MGEQSIPEGAVAAAVGADPSEFEVAPHRPAGVAAFGRRNAVESMLAEQKKVSGVSHHVYDEAERMTLRSGNDLPIPTDKRNKRSGFDRRLAYKGPYLGYYVQNRKIYKGGVKVVPLEEVPEEVTETKVGKGMVAETVKLREMIAFALDISDQEALDADPLRCKVCIDFRGDSDIDLMVHFRRKHPKELDQLADGIEKMRADREAEEELPPAPPPQKPKRQTFNRAGH